MSKDQYFDNKGKDYNIFSIATLQYLPIFYLNVMINYSYLLV